MRLPPIGQPPEENCYDCFYACKAAVMIKVGVGVRVSCMVRFSFRVSFTVRVSVRVIKVAILSCNCEAT